MPNDNLTVYGQQQRSLADYRSEDRIGPDLGGRGKRWAAPEAGILLLVSLFKLG